jgi:hypothetical protein
VSDRDVYNRTIDALKEAGFSLVRTGPHEIWQSESKDRGVALSHNIRDKNLARSLLRSAGIEVKP